METTRELLNNVLALLYDCRGRYLSVDELARAAGVSAARVRRVLADVKARGHVLESSPAQGLRLARPVRLDAHLVERNLPVEFIGKHVICFDDVASTNDTAFGAAGAAARRTASKKGQQPEALVVTAEHQRAGRGRLGRKWISPAGANLLASALLPAGELTRRLPLEAVTIAAGLAVAEGIEEAVGLSPHLDWPNDVMLDGAKLAGVIVETRPAQAGRHVVIGFGVNVNAAPPAELVGQPAVCLAEALGHAVERIDLLRATLARLDHWVVHLGQAEAQQIEESLRRLHEAWMQRCRMVNARLSVLAGGRSVTGRVLDVSPLEGLILLTDDGRRLELPAETSSVIRGSEED